MNFKPYCDNKLSIYSDLNNKNAPITAYSKVNKNWRVKSSQDFPYMEIYGDEVNKGLFCSRYLDKDTAILSKSNLDSSGNLYTTVWFSKMKMFGNNLDMRLGKYGIINYDTLTMLFFDGYQFKVRKIDRNGNVLGEQPIEGFYKGSFRVIDLPFFHKEYGCDGDLNPGHFNNDYFDNYLSNGFGFSLDDWDKCFRIGCSKGSKLHGTAMWLQNGKIHVGHLEYGKRTDEYVVVMDPQLKMFSVGKLTESGLDHKGLTVEVWPNKARIYSDKQNYGPANSSYVLEWDAVSNKAIMYFIDGNGEKIVDSEVN